MTLLSEAQFPFRHKIQQCWMPLTLPFRHSLAACMTRTVYKARGVSTWCKHVVQARGAVVRHTTVCSPALSRNYSKFFLCCLQTQASCFVCCCWLYLNYLSYDRVFSYCCFGRSQTSLRSFFAYSSQFLFSTLYIDWCLTLY